MAYIGIEGIRSRQSMLDCSAGTTAQMVGRPGQAGGDTYGRVAAPGRRTCRPLRNFSRLIALVHA